MARRLAWRSIPRLARIALLASGTLVALVVIGAGVAVLSFDPNSLKPRIIEAVKRETGRDIALKGPIKLAFALRPTIAANDVAFPNPAGFSRPQMATLAQLDLQLALLPLLSGRIEIDRLVLVRPDISLETDAQGRPNWQFTPEPTPPATPKPTGGSTPKEHSQVGIADVEVQDGQLTWHDGQTRQSVVLGVQRLEARAASPDSQVHLDAIGTIAGTDLTLVGEVGSLGRLMQPTGDTPWPVQLTLNAGGVQLSLDGSLTKPLQARGYTLKLAATAPDLTALAPFLPGQKLPPLHDVAVTAQLSYTGNPLPDLSGLTLHVGRSDLSGSVAGLQLDKLDASAPRLDQPLQLSAQGSLAGQALTATAALGAPNSFLPGAPSTGPFPVDVTLQSGGASLALKGSIAQLQALTGIDLAVTATVANLAALSPLARRPLPALQSIGFTGHLHDSDGGLRKGFALQAAKLTLPQGDIAGDATLALTTPPSLQATVKSGSIDLDALRAAFATPQAEAPAASATPAPSAAAPSPPSQPAPVAKNSRVIPDTPLPFGLLHSANADVTFAINQLKSGGALYRAVAAHLVLRDGKLTLDPFAAELPEGKIAGSLDVDAAKAPPTVALRLHAPALAVQPVLAAIGQPAFASGNLEVYADLRGAGATPHAIAASLDGSLGLAMANGSLDNRLVGSTLGSVMHDASLLDLVGRGGTSQVQCFASRMDASNGVGTFRTLMLASTLLTAEAEGSVNLGNETLSLRARTAARVGGTGLVVPLRIAGTFRSPAAAPDPAAAVAENAGTIAGAIGNKSPFGIIAGALAGPQAIAAPTAEDCGRALAIARGDTPGPATQVAQQPAPASPVAKPKPPNVGNVLRQLLR
jgi:AsmA protein